MAHAAVLVIIVVAAIVAVVALVLAGRRVERKARLKHRFGPEYERLVTSAGSAPRAEAELEARERRVKAYHIQSLSAAESAQYESAWRRLQARFIDEPAETVVEADALVTDVMRRRGYPMEDFDARANDLSVDHGEVVVHYREAHRIATGPPPSTESLRQALVHYRVLFEDLLGGNETHRRESA